ncbi:hypothetical protein TNCV_3177271 [Trichonephila clavipes]|nr:hypothetical protein TNCV_3177271 [Trichonephila clavipes]
MLRLRIRAHYEQLPEFERGRRLPGQRADPAFTIARQTCPQQEVIFLGVISLEARFLWSSFFQQDNAKPHTTDVDMNCLTAYQTLFMSSQIPL